MELMASVEEESSSSVVVFSVGEFMELMLRGGLSVSLVGWSS